MDIKKELMKFYVWQRNNCNKVEELKDIEEMVDIYMTKREVNKTNDIHNVMPRVKETIEQLLKESEEGEKDIEKYGKDTMALAVQKAHSYSFAIALQVIKRYEA